MTRASKRLRFQKSKPDKHTDAAMDEMKDDASEDKFEEDNLNDFRIHTTYITVTIKLPKNSDFIKYLHNKYTILIDTLLQADEELLINPYDPKHDLTDTKSLRAAKDLPNKMTALQRFIAVTTRCPKPGKGATIWANLRISHDSEFEEIMNLTSFDLESNEINLMTKRIQAHKSHSPGYFHFICNQSDPDDVYNQITADVGDTWNWTLYNKIPWEGFKTSFQKNSAIDKTDWHKKALAIECRTEDAEDLVSAIRTWIKKGTALPRFGPHIKFVEALTSKTPPMQTERTIRMNGHGRRFQASVGLMHLEGLTNPDGIVTIKKKSITVRKLTLQRVHDNNPMFLSITRKWQSNAWHGVYIKSFEKACMEFAACPAAWLAHDITKAEANTLYKHFTPEAVTEASLSTWDNNTKRMITPSEKEALAEESAVSSIPWMIDLTELDTSLDESQSVTFKDGAVFDFKDDISLNTTRVPAKVSIIEQSLASSPNRPLPVSILKSSPDAMTVTSEFTTETRIGDLETSVEKLTSDTNEILNLLKAQTKATNVAPASGSGEKS